MALDIVKNHAQDYENGLKCELFGVPVRAMSRDELVVFIGFLDSELTWYIDAELTRYIAKTREGTEKTG